MKTGHLVELEPKSRCRFPEDLELENRRNCIKKVTRIVTLGEFKTQSSQAGDLCQPSTALCQKPYVGPRILAENAPAREKSITRMHLDRLARRQNVAVPPSMFPLVGTSVEDSTPEKPTLRPFARVSIQFRTRMLGLHPTIGRLVDRPSRYQVAKPLSRSPVAWIL